jgi:hypothetical protein
VAPFKDPISGLSFPDFFNNPPPQPPNPVSRSLRIHQHEGCDAAFTARPHSSARTSVIALPFCRISNYCWKTRGGPLTRFHFSETFTSTRLAILMKGIFLFIP